jgi:predicted DNA-binding ribbon-helix-helix protein
LTLEPHVFEELKVIAKAENRSLSNLIESWVLAELQRRRKP